ncbi:CHAT domain-containing protein [Pseudogemmobacter sonorensis]|uniref:CHAT domain-containing protein n=1 Tax=Pseudogemmobacter sonorensis TaxID=2989681 RepID=UPI0036A3FC5C
MSASAPHRPVSALLFSLALAALAAGAAPARQEPGLSNAAYEGAQWIMFTSAARAVAGMGARLVAGEDELGALIRAHQELDLRIEAEAAAFRAALARGEDGAAEGATLRLSRADFAALEAELTARFPDYAEFSFPRPMSLAETQAHLAPHEALVLILPGPSGSYVWAVTPDGHDWIRAPVTREELAADVRALRADLDPSGGARGAVALEAEVDGEAGWQPRRPGFDRARAHRLYEALLAPLAPRLEGAEVVHLVTEGPLASLPLSLLVTAPPLGEDSDPAALQATEWLLRRHALVTLPAVTSLRALRAARPVQSGAKTGAGVGFVGIGDPVLLGPGARQDRVADEAAMAGGYYAHPDAIRALAPLPGTARELRAIAAAFPEGEARLFLREAARESALRDAGLEEARVISFATHGLLSDELAGLAEPALVLTPPGAASEGDDGLLTASEAAMLRLSADWVILSACNTAGGDSLGAESLSGLARAFFFAGARSLLVSHWPVRDDAAAALVSQTVTAQVGGMDRAGALRLAMLELMARPDGRFAHPSAWAPFVLVGEGGAQ